MNAFTGTGAMVRLALRRDRVALPVWLAIFVMIAVASASATVGLYPDEASRVKAANTVNLATSLVALYGRIYDTSSIGALAIFKLTGTLAIFVAVLAILTVVRHTRAEEETGRGELVGATVVGRLAPLAAALAVTIGASVALGVLTALGMVAAGLPAGGSWAFGLAWTGIGLSFAAIGAVAAQLTSSARAASGLAIAFLGLSYVVRAVGDTAGAGGPRWATWLSPFGWSQQIHAYAGNRWWVALVIVGFTAVVVTVAGGLMASRDAGGGVLPVRLGPPRAAASLCGSPSLAWRLQRGSLIGWSAGFALLGLFFGSITSSVSGFMDSPQAREVFLKLGGEKGLTEAYLAATLSLVGVIASAYGVQAAMRLRSEEAQQRVEPLLATGTTRISWVLSHTVVALLGTTVLMLVHGAAIGLAYGVQVKDGSQIGRMILAALAQVPAAWVLVGLVVCVFGVAPRLAIAGWVAYVLFIVLGEVGPLMQLDQWVMNLSPYAHVPRLPGGPVEALPLVVLVGVTGLLIALGLVAFRRRDVPAT